MNTTVNQPKVSFTGYPVAGAAFLGSHSLFVDWSKIGKTGYWIHPLLGLQSDLVLSDFQAVISPVTIPPFPLQALATDADIYRPGQTAHVPVYLPRFAKQQVTMRPFFQSVEEQGFTLTLDEFGMAHYIVPNLKKGDYRVTVKEAPEAEVTFTVAKFQLKALNAVLKVHQVESGKLTAIVEVKTYGTPFRDGIPFRIELQLNGMQHAVQHIETKDSSFMATFDLPQMDGQLSILLMNEQKPDQIAQVVVPGSRKAIDRAGTVISALATTWESSTMALTGGQDERGLSVRERPMTSGNAPVELVSVVCEDGMAQFRLTADCKVLLFQIYNPESGEYEAHRFNNRKKEEIVSFTFIGVWARPYISAWVDTRGGVKPWEGASTLIKANKMTLSVIVPEKCAPNSTITLGITASGAPTARLPIWVTVSDDRLAQSQRLQAALANRVQTGFTSTPLPDASFVNKDLAAAYQTPISKGNLRMASVNSDQNWRVVDGNTRSVGDNRRSYEPASYSLPLGFDEDESVLESMQASKSTMLAPTVTQQVVLTETREEQDLGTIYAGLLYIQHGRAELPIRLPNVITTLRVSAFALSGDHYGEVTQRVEVTTDLFTKLQLPLELMQGEQTVATAYLHSKAGAAYVNVLVNGQPQQFAIGPAIFNAGTFVRTFPCNIAFDVQAGDHVVVSLTDEAGHADMVEGTVGAMGKYTYTVKIPQVLQQGQQVSVGGDVLSLRVFPGPMQVISQMTTTINHVNDHDCFGQTGQKIAANMVMALQGNQEAIAAVIAGVQRAESMYVPSQGAKYYPQYPFVELADWQVPGVTPNYGRFYWVHMGIMALWGLRLWVNHPVLTQFPQLGKAVKKGALFGQNCAALYSIHNQSQPGPGKSMRAYYEMSLDSWNVEPVVPYVQDLLRQPMPSIPGERREIQAYASAIFARAKLWKQSLDLANRVLAELDKHGKPGSYSEMVAVMLMMSELHALQKAQLVVNGVFPMDAAQAAVYDVTPIAGVACTSGAVIVEKEVARSEDWDAFDVTIPLQVEVTDRNGQPVSTVMRGDALRMKVTLTNGYQAGQLIALKACHALSFMNSGADVKEVEIDPKGADSVTFDLFASQSTAFSIESFGQSAQQLCWVVARDMNDERQWGSVKVGVSVL